MFSDHPISRSHDHPILTGLLPYHNLVNDLALAGFTLSHFQRNLVLLLILHGAADGHRIIVGGGFQVRSRQNRLLIESVLELALDVRVADMSGRLGVRRHLLGWRLLVRRSIVPARLRIRIERRRARYRLLLAKRNRCNKKQESAYNAFHKDLLAYLDAKKAISR